MDAETEANLREHLAFAEGVMRIDNSAECEEPLDYRRAMSDFIFEERADGKLRWVEMQRATRKILEVDHGSK